jgi:hypothetical protein
MTARRGTLKGCGLFLLVCLSTGQMCFEFPDLSSGELMSSITAEIELGGATYHIDQHGTWGASGSNLYFGPVLNSSNGDVDPPGGPNVRLTVEKRGSASEQQGVRNTVTDLSDPTSVGAVVVTAAVVRAQGLDVVGQPVYLEDRYSSGTDFDPGLGYSYVAGASGVVRIRQWEPLTDGSHDASGNPRDWLADIELQDVVLPLVDPASGTPANVTIRSARFYCGR